MPKEDSASVEFIINQYWNKLLSNCEEWASLFQEPGQVLDSSKLLFNFFSDFL